MNATKAVTTLLLVALVSGGLYWYRGRGIRQGSKIDGQAAQRLAPLFGATEQDIKQAKLLLVNVLDKDEFDDAHIIGGKGVLAINVPFIETDRALALLPKNTAIVTYCSNYFCSACHTVAEQMTKAGFTNVKVFGGGMAEWYQLSQKEPAKYPIAGPAQRPYLKMRVNQPVKQEGGLTIISAQELQKLIEDITILP